MKLKDFVPNGQPLSRLCFVTSMAAAFQSVTAQLPTYSLQGIEIEGMEWVYAHAISNTGYVSGSAGGQNYFGSWRGAAPFLWKDSQVIRQDGPTGYVYEYNAALDVNDDGLTAGSSSEVWGNDKGRVWESSGQTRWILDDTVSGINNHGDAVGISNPSHNGGTLNSNRPWVVKKDGDTYPQPMFIDPGAGNYGEGWENGNMVDINEDGQALGEFTYSSGGKKAFLYKDGNFQWMQTPGPASDVYVRDLNESGDVVGTSLFASGWSATSWHQGVPTILGGYFGYHTQALSVNSGGVAVGFAWGNGFIYPNEGAALVWNNGVATALHSLVDDSVSGWDLGRATGINDQGWISGVGSHNGRPASWILKPVPEPASITALGLGAVALLRRRRSAK